MPLPLTNRRTVTYSITYNVPDERGKIRVLPVEFPFRQIREELEELAVADGCNGDTDECGDVRMTIRRRDWALVAELDVHYYEPEPESVEE